MSEFLAPRFLPAVLLGRIPGKAVREDAEEDFGRVVVEDLTVGVGDTFRGPKLGTAGAGGGDFD